MHSCPNSGVLDACMVKLLVFAAQSEENQFCILLARLLHHDGLEAACECTVLCEVLLVLTERRRTDNLHLAAGKGRLQDVCCIQ